jgi:hypothetical protein
MIERSHYATTYLASCTTLLSKLGRYDLVLTEIAKIIKIGGHR